MYKYKILLDSTQGSLLILRMLKNKFDSVLVDKDGNWWQDYSSLSDIRHSIQLGNLDKDFKGCLHWSLNILDDIIFTNIHDEISDIFEQYCNEDMVFEGDDLEELLIKVATTVQLVG